MEPTSFGRYQLLDLLGRGGMGEVWRAFDTVTERHVALKVLPPNLAGDSVFQERFRREARVAASLDEPHVVPIYDFGEIEGRLFVTMRLINGRDLGQLLGTGPLPPQRAVTVVDQVASALQAAHATGLIHRDIKPSNILVTDNDFTYLIDFGIARATTETGLTSTGAVIGTWAYMAPERLNTGTTDARSDIYALACVLHESLTGQRPYPGDSLEQQIVGHLTTPPPRPSAMVAGVPPALDAVIQRGLSKDPDQRYQRVGDLAQAARQAVTAPTHFGIAAARTTPISPPATDELAKPQPLFGPSSPTVHRPAGAAFTPAPQRRSRRNIVLAGAAAVIAIIAVVAVLVVNRGGSEPEPAAKPMAAPTTTEELDNSGPLTGVYRVDFGEQTPWSGAPFENPGPPLTTTFGFRSVCTSGTECVATASVLSEIDVDESSTLSAVTDLVFDDIGGRWIATAVVSVECKSNGAEIEFWQAFVVTPRPDGTLVGEYLVTSRDCGSSKRAMTLTRTGHVTHSDGVSDPAELAARIAMPAADLWGHYDLSRTFVDMGEDPQVSADLVAHTFCLRTGDRCAAGLYGVSNYFLEFINGAYRFDSQWDGQCSGNGDDSHVIESWSLTLPQPPQVPIATMTGTGNHESTGRCGRTVAINVLLERVGN